LIYSANTCNDLNQKIITKLANNRKEEPKNYISKGIIWLIKNHANEIQPSTHKWKPTERDKNKIAKSANSKKTEPKNYTSKGII